MKTSGSRAKSSRQPAGSLNGPGTRATPAYASASPLEFQEPWQDEVAPSSRPTGSANTDLQHREKQSVAPVLSEDDLPENWEEAATADEASDQGLQEAESAPEHAERVGNEGVSSAVDDESLDETPHPERTSPNPVARCVTEEAILGEPATARPADADQEETVAAATSPTSDRDAATAADKLAFDGN